jgi:hypothetical protein
MNQEQITKLERAIDNLKNKTSKIYLFAQDTKGNAKASVAYIYRMGMALLDGGFNPIILTEKNDYHGVSSWLGEDYMTKLPHQSVEGQNLEIGPEDFVVLPEIYSFIMEQIAKLPCGKIVLSQSYDHVFETLNPGQTWTQFGFLKCITTSEKQKEYLSNVFRHVSFDVIEPLISDEFTKNEKPQKPFIAIHSREHRDSINIIKQFYVKFPQYRWITFKDMRGVTESEFAKSLNECCVSVWIDETSSYGTFPLESIKSGVPVIGLTPNMLPEWMNENNGFWVNNKLDILDLIADFIQNWLEDSIKEEIYTEMDITSSKLQTKENFENSITTIFEGYLNTRLESFELQASKLQTIEE